MIPPDAYQQASPFPHAVLDGLFDPTLLYAVAAEFPNPDDGRWRRYGNERELKLEGGYSCWGDATLKLASRISAMSYRLQHMTGINDLVMEPVGGGMHLIPPGGRLAVHADFNRSPDTRRFRRINFLVYLNDGWTEADGGHLELHGAEESVWVLPVFNRTVIFTTSGRSFHGHPEPLPGPLWRKSFAAYFFTDTPPEGYMRDHSTVWA